MAVKKKQNKFQTMYKRITQIYILFKKNWEINWYLNGKKKREIERTYLRKSKK